MKNGYAKKGSNSCETTSLTRELPPTELNALLHRGSKGYEQSTNYIIRFNTARKFSEDYNQRQSWSGRLLIMATKPFAGHLPSLFDSKTLVQTEIVQRRPINACVTVISLYDT